MFLSFSVRSVFFFFSLFSSFSLSLFAISIIENFHLYNYAKTFIITSIWLINYKFMSVCYFFLLFLCVSFTYNKKCSNSARNYNIFLYRKRKKLISISSSRQNFLRHSSIILIKLYIEKKTTREEELIA